MKNKTIFISQLSKETQDRIRKDLETVGLPIEEIQIAMDSRLCDLEELLSVDIYLIDC